MPQVRKRKFELPQTDRLETMFEYLRHTPGVRDVVVSGGDIADLPWPRLEEFVGALLGDRQHPGHPAGQQGADGAAAALAER